MDIKPIGLNILVRPFEPKKETEAGIIIPITAQERPSMATVLAVGEGAKDYPMVIDIGDIVFHVKNCGTPIPFEGEVLYFMRQQDVLAIQKDKSNGVAKKDVVNS